MVLTIIRVPDPPNDDAEKEYGPFVASSERLTFHRPHCKWAREINKKHKVKYKSHADAIAAGKKPCKTCGA